MVFCRDIFTLGFASLVEKEIKLIDAFCASGIRGIRYALESDKKVELTFLDLVSEAREVVESNLTRNGLRGRIITNNFISYARTTADRYDFVEIDPFGSALPFIDAGVYLVGKRGYVSITATDTQVLCGANQRACRKYYSASSLNNYFCHETGVRLLIATIARKALEQNKGLECMLSLAKRHYIKVIVRVSRGNLHSTKTLERIGYMQFCRDCLWFGRYEIGEKAFCANCGRKTVVIGPLWLGNIQDEGILSSMLKKCQDPGILKQIEMMKNDDLGLFFYDMHMFCKAHKLKLKSLKDVLECLREKGFNCGRCYFKPNGIKGNFSYTDFVECLS